MTERGRGKPVKRGDVVPSIADHNLDLPRYDAAEPAGLGDRSIVGPGVGGDQTEIEDDTPKRNSGASRGFDGGGDDHPTPQEHADPGQNAQTPNNASAEVNERRDRRFPAGLLLAPGALGLLVAASAGPIAARNQLGLAGGVAVALIAGGVAAACFGAIATRSEPGVGRVLGPAGLVLATLAAGSSIAQLI